MPRRRWTRVTHRKCLALVSSGRLPPMWIAVEDWDVRHAQPAAVLHGGRLNVLVGGCGGGWPLNHRGHGPELLPFPLQQFHRGYAPAVVGAHEDRQAPERHGADQRVAPSVSSPVIILMSGFDSRDVDAEVRPAHV